jgi:ABC-2 type transport system ATP-binding protein
MAAPAVRTERLTKDFVSGFWRTTTHRALDSVSFEVPSGCTLGLLGLNGAGKSTTLKLLLNLLFPTSGSCEVFGRSPADTGVRRRVGFMPEEPAMFQHLSGEQFVAYCAGLFGFDAGDRRRRAAATLDRVGLAADRRRPLGEYSKGMLQRVGLAQALVNDPELVVLDEPMSGLDPAGRRDLRDLLGDLGREGRTVIFSSHILSDVERLCSHVVVLNRGRVAAFGPLAEALSAGPGQTLEDRFLEIVRSPPGDHL